MKVLLTHTPQSRAQYYGARSLEGLQAIAQVKLHQSNDALDPAGLIRAAADVDIIVADRDLLPHEYTHSWNGKFRRGADLATPNFNVPMQDSLLWVYEGQTQYWGNVLAGRSGLRTPEQARDALASFGVKPESEWRCHGGAP